MTITCAMGSLRPENYVCETSLSGLYSKTVSLETNTVLWSMLMGLHLLYLGTTKSSLEKQGTCFISSKCERNHTGSPTSSKGKWGLVSFFFFERQHELGRLFPLFTFTIQGFTLLHRLTQTPRLQPSKKLAPRSPSIVFFLSYVLCTMDEASTLPPRCTTVMDSTQLSLS